MCRMCDRIFSYGPNKIYGQPLKNMRRCGLFKQTISLCKGCALQISLAPLNTLSHSSFVRKFISKKLNELPVNIFFRNYIYLVSIINRKIFFISLKCAYLSV